MNFVVPVILLGMFLFSCCPRRLMKILDSDQAGWNNFWEVVYLVICFD